MVEQATITERDLRQLLDVIDAGRDVVEGEQFPHEVLRSLQRLIPSIDVTFVISRPYDRVTISLDEADDRPWVPDDDEDGRELHWNCWWHSPGVHPLVTGDRSVFRDSDLLDRYTPPEWRLQCPQQAVHEICVPFPPRGGENRNLVLFREPGHDFTDREQMLLSLLQPHLWEMRRRVEHVQAGTPELSARQWEVLRLVADGYSTAAIARRLFVAESTVRKHLENVYERLGVGTRTAAVAAAFPTAASV